MSNPDLLMGQVLQNNVIFNKILVHGSAGRYLASESRGRCEVLGVRGLKTESSLPGQSKAQGHYRTECSRGILSVSK